MKNYTKEQLLGRKIRSANIYNYTFIINDAGELGLKAEKDGKDYFNNYDLDYCNRTIQAGIWVLFPEETMYKTPKGITYQVGSQFTHTRDCNIIYTIDSLSKNGGQISWLSPSYDYRKVVNTITVSKFNRCFDEGFWVIVNNNQMKKTEIEVGDIVHHVSGDTCKHTVLNVNGDKGIILTKNKSMVNISMKNLTLVSKASQQEIIGYELLKDLPGIPAGTKSQNAKEGNNYFFDGANTNNRVRFTSQEIKDTTWFKPIYKPKEVVVKISGGREAIIGATHVFIKGQGAVSFEDVTYIYKLITGTNKGTSTALVISIETFKVGCQTFTKEDIVAVYNAVKSLK